MSSFLNFSRMSPRERMLAGLRGQLSPTFGLEVGSPRAQLGVIPLAGLGRDGRFGYLGITDEEEEAKAVYAYTPPTSSTVVFADPMAISAPTTAYQYTVSAPTQTTVMSTPFTQPAPSTTAPSTEASAPASSPTKLAPAPTGVKPLAPPSSAQIQSDEPDDDYYAPGKKVKEGEFDAYDVGEEEDEGYANYAEEAGSEAGAQAFDVDVERTRRIKSPATGVEMFWQKAAPYLPWVLGGGALVGLAYMLGKKKG